MGYTHVRHAAWRDHARPATGGFLVRWVLLGSLVVGLTTVGAVAAPAGAAVAATCAVPSSPMTAADAASTIGVTATSITAGNVSTLSGPVSVRFSGAPVGVRAYFDDINAHGGVHGRRLLLDSTDDAFSGPQDATGVQDAAGRDFALVGSFSLFDGFGCNVLAASPGVADVSVTHDRGTSALGNDFSVQPLVPGSSLGGLRYYRKKFPKDRTVGTIVLDVASAEAQWTGREAALKHVGYRVGYVRDISPLESDFTTDVIAMRNDHVDAVDLTGVDWQDAAIFMTNAAAQKWHPGLIFSGGPVYDDRFVAQAGGARVTSGIQIGQAQALYLGQDASGVPAVASFLASVKKVDAAGTPDLATLYGWASAALFVRALRAAGAHPTRGTLIAQLGKITQFDAGGLVAPADPAGKRPSACFVLLQIARGRFQRVLPRTGGFDCRGGYFPEPGS